ncbi:Serine/threonine-protein kinase-like protein CCR1 [Heracleum sosnowskyi]|uniref:Serine/threonine-protein kinase-like protein CCR1 n=1 Tax=Heracleum sosnowskyi TaxID=360622 RepID=A0AAD8J2S5_9APIA|nr:Serine/threonine-protein kinase-like protein CCR1 [Heracleum sosnowskyi]
MTSTRDYDPPFQLCSLGLCTPGSCGQGRFVFNASSLHETDLSSLCVRKELSICSPCGINCSEGFFTSNSCSENADRVCTTCSLCQNISCWDICRLHPLSDMKRKHQHQLRRLIFIGVASASGLVLILICWCLLPSLFANKNKRGTTKQYLALCLGRELETETLTDSHPPVVVTPCFGVAQIFRLNELGRGSYGFVYKALLPDGRQVAVKRATTIIHINNRDFEMELEILYSIRHTNIVNLLGYCAEMGERLLVYEFMPHQP